MKYSLCLLIESKNNFALLSVFLPTRGIYIQLGAKKTLSASKCDSPFLYGQTSNSHGQSLPVAVTLAAVIYF